MEPVTIDLPADSLVVLVGAAGSGKTTFARRHFEPGRILSSDDFRALVADDAADQDATADAFRALHAVTRARLRRGLLTVIDATNVRFASRESLLSTAARYRRPAIAIALDLPLETCLARNAARSDRAPVPDHVVREHTLLFRRSIPHLGEEGFRQVIVLGDASQAMVRVATRR